MILKFTTNTYDNPHLIERIFYYYIKMNFSIKISVVKSKDGKIKYGTMCLCILYILSQKHMLEATCTWLDLLYKELKPSAAVNIYEGLILPGVDRRLFKWCDRV